MHHAEREGQRGCRGRAPALRLWLRVLSAQILSFTHVWARPWAWCYLRPQDLQEASAYREQRHPG